MTVPLVMWQQNFCSTFFLVQSLMCYISVSFINTEDREKCCLNPKRTLLSSRPCTLTLGTFLFVFLCVCCAANLWRRIQSLPLSLAVETESTIWDCTGLKNTQFQNKQIWALPASCCLPLSLLYYSISRFFFLEMAGYSSLPQTPTSSNCFPSSAVPA